MPEIKIIPERLAILPTLHIDGGGHDDFDEGHCSMELVAWMAGEGWTDAPKCASPVLREYVISLNDQWSSEQRQKLAPYLPRMVGTGDDGRDEIRSYLALDWLIRSYTPAWLDLAGLTAEAQELRDLRRIVDLADAHAAQPAVRAIRDKVVAAWVAARDAARVAAGDAAWDAAGDAARDAAWDAAGDAARVAAGVAAGVAAWVAARDAARVAAGDALRPTVDSLQESALELLDRMIDAEVSA